MMRRAMEATVKQPVHDWNFDNGKESIHKRMVQISSVVLKRDLDELKAAINLGLDVNEWYNANPDALNTYISNNPYPRRTFQRLRDIPGADRIQMLHLAATCRWKEGVEELIKAGADVNAYDYRAFPLLHESTTATSFSPLMHACCCASVPQVKELLENGADPSAKDPHSGATPMSLALRVLSYPILKLLLDSGANFTEKDASAIPLQELVEVFNNPRLKVTNAHQYNPKQLNKKIEEVRSVALRLMELFLNNGVDPNMKTEESLPPLHMCAEGSQGDLRGLELLVSHGADINLLCKGTFCHKHSHLTPLLAAVIGENGLPAVQWLIQQGANVDQKVKRYYRGRSVGDPISILTIALEEGLPHMVSVLIRAGCEVTLQDVEAMKRLLSDMKSVEMESFQETGQHSPHTVAAIENIEAMLEFLRQPKNLMWQIRKVLRTKYNVKQVGEDEEAKHERMLQISKVVMQKDITELKNAIRLGFDVNEWFNANPESLKSFSAHRAYTAMTPRHSRETSQEDRIQILHLATACKWKEGVEELINAGAEVNAYDYRVFPELKHTHQTPWTFFEHKKSYTPLMHACCYGNVPQVKVLIDNKADPSAVDPLSGATPISLALRFFSYPILKLLLESGAVLREKDALATPLQEIVEIFNNPKLKVTNAHQYNSEQLDEMTEEVRSVALQFMNHFLSNGVDPNMIRQGPQPLPAIHMCAEGSQGDLRGLKMLVEHGADVNLLCKGACYHRHTHMTPLLSAVLGENGLPAAQWLIQQGANVDQKMTRYYRGRSVGDPISILTIALEEGLPHMASVLIRAGCEVTPQDVEAMKGLMTDLKSVDMESFQETGQHSPYIVATIENIEGLLNFLKQPKNLMWQIRKVLRSNHGVKQEETVNTLPLPRPLKNYILCHDL